LGLIVGRSEPLTATVSPANAFNQNVTWWSSNPEVATIDNWGNITAVAEGIVDITVQTECGGFTATAAVNVEGVIING
jgi:uncharacterized protein YjdB